MFIIISQFSVGASASSPARHCGDFSLETCTSYVYGCCICVANLIAHQDCGVLYRLSSLWSEMCLDFSLFISDQI